MEKLTRMMVLWLAETKKKTVFHIIKSRHLQMFCNIGVLKKFTKLTGKIICYRYKVTD